MATLTCVVRDLLDEQMIFTLRHAGIDDDKDRLLQNASTSSTDYTAATLFFPRCYRAVTRFATIWMRAPEDGDYRRGVDGKQYHDVIRRPAPMYKKLDGG